MAIAALNSAATGLRALSTRIDVVANNLANAETTAFKSSRCNFEDLTYVVLRQPGARNAQDQISPAGIQVGSGVAISNTAINLQEGPLENTGNDLDVAVEGAGFFRVQMPPSIGNGEGFTRNGQLFINEDGDLVVGSRDGFLIEPTINIDTNYETITIANDGTVSVKLPDQTEQQVAGRIQLNRFPNPKGLLNLGSSVYIETDASGPPNELNPTEDGAGTIRQGFLEASNVDPVKELVTMIKTQRAFELNSQSIQTADQALQTIANLRRA
ncbi:MAG TPA: flagellar basal-body rod protein FlgG [Tepidisphaeraceae bacterium]|nr:flagellar basal-body rod protein FlgG [Tepidisphaeraceae bacterium]